MARQYNCGCAVLGREIIGLCGWLHETLEDFRKEYGMERVQEKHGFVESIYNPGRCFCGGSADDPIHQVVEGQIATPRPCAVCGKERLALAGSTDLVYFNQSHEPVCVECWDGVRRAKPVPAPSSSIAESIIRHASGKVSSRIPPFHLIPRAALVAGALRFAKGIRVKKDGAWNAANGLDDHNKVMEDTQFIIDRLGHCIDHAYLAIARLQGLLPYDAEEDADGGDAGAIFFASALLACRMEYERSAAGKNQGPCGICGLLRINHPHTISGRVDHDWQQGVR